METIAKAKERYYNNPTFENYANLSLVEMYAKEKKQQRINNA